MDWWLILIGLAVLALLRYLWVTAFHSGETVSSMPELDGYVSGESDLARSHPDTTEQHLPTLEPPTVTVTGSDPDETTPPGEADDGGTETDVDDGGIWIEIDIEPLFASSESRQIAEVTESEDPEVTP